MTEYPPLRGPLAGNAIVDLIRPHGRIISNFGDRLPGTSRPNSGMNIVSAPHDTGVLAIADGTINKVLRVSDTTLNQMDRGLAGDLGNSIWITCSNGTVVVYSGMASIPGHITQGAHIASGRKIGTVGTTGAHLAQETGQTPPQVYIEFRTPHGDVLAPTIDVINAIAQGSTSPSIPRSQDSTLLPSTLLPTPPVHTVAEGDTLATVARRYFGDGIAAIRRTQGHQAAAAELRKDIGEIAMENGILLDAPLRVGMRLTIPIRSPAVLGGPDAGHLTARDVPQARRSPPPQTRLPPSAPPEAHFDTGSSALSRHDQRAIRRYARKIAASWHRMAHDGHYGPLKVDIEATTDKHQPTGTPEQVARKNDRLARNRAAAFEHELRADLHRYGVTGPIKTHVTTRFSARDRAARLMGWSVDAPRPGGFGFF